jgi:hypothetical protein
MPPRATTVREMASLLATHADRDQLASDGYINLLSAMTTYNLNRIASITTSVLNVRILYLFGASLNAFKI